MKIIWEERKSGWSKRDSDARSNWDVDYARIIHSGSFRRLQGKTQILNLGDSDFYRTRLTHSLEVSQIASGVTRQIEKDNEGHDIFDYLPDLPMIQAIACAHDLGHPPFGHGGEVALNYCMRGNSGGFEGNGQTLRILSKLEKFSENNGADLTRRTLLGTLKYPIKYSLANGSEMSPKLVKNTTTVKLIDRASSKPPKCYMDSEMEVVEWILKDLSKSDHKTFTEMTAQQGGKHKKSSHKSLDCSIMDVADDISYGIHDFEDAIALRLIDKDDFEDIVTPEKCSTYLDYLKERYPTEYENDIYGQFVNQIFGRSQERKHTISRLVGFFIANAEIVENLAFDEPLLKYRIAMNGVAEKFLNALKKIVTDIVIKSPEVQHLEFKGQQMVVAVFEVLESEPKAFLPRDIYKDYKNSGEDLRVICDYVAGMTDSYLLKTYERLFSPRLGSVFDKL